MTIHLFALALNYVLTESKNFDYVCGRCSTLLSTPHVFCVMITECHNFHSHSQSLSTSFDNEKYIFSSQNIKLRSQRSKRECLECIGHQVDCWVPLPFHSALYYYKLINKLSDSPLVLSAITIILYFIDKTAMVCT